MDKFFDVKNCIGEISDVPIIDILDHRFPNALYTFCIPTYKRSKDLKFALDSVLAQSKEILFNVIVSDNNPDRQDETELLMLSYKHYSNIRYIKNTKNIGMAGNWNRLIQLAETPYMIMLHDDDCLFNGYLDYIHEVVNKKPNITALNASKQTWTGLGAIKTIYSRPVEILNHTLITELLYMNFGPPSGCLFNVNDLKEVGGFDPISYPSIDYHLILKLCLKEKLVCTTTTPLMYYRIVENATSKLETQIKWLDIEYRLKNELCQMLHLSPITEKIVQSLNIKFRLREIRKTFALEYKYKGFKEGGYAFLFFYNLILGFVIFFVLGVINRKKI